MDDPLLNQFEDNWSRRWQIVLCAIPSHRSQTICAPLLQFNKIRQNLLNISCSHGFAFKSRTPTFLFIYFEEIFREIWNFLESHPICGLIGLAIGLYICEKTDSWAWQRILIICSIGVLAVYLLINFLECHGITVPF